MTFGWGTVVAIVRDESAERADLRVRDLQRDCHALGIMARIETLNAPEAIESSWPANGTSNIRRPLMSGANFTDLILPADHWPGLPYIDSPFFPERTPTPLICGGAGSRLPFYYPTHVNGVANQLIIGPSGTGKSSLIGAMVAAYLGIPEAHIAWIDSRLQLLRAGASAQRPGGLPQRRRGRHAAAVPARATRHRAERRRANL